jgi:hypothetical protein
MVVNMTQKLKSELDLGLKYDIELELRDKDGKLLKKWVQEGRSWVKWFLFLLYIYMAQSSFTITKTDGSSVSQSPAVGMLSIAAGWGSDTAGIVVGTSDLAWSIEQYKLDSKISHGNGSGQLLYGVTTVDDVTPMTNGYRIFVSRVFNNNSGSSVIVKEVGIYCGVPAMFARDVLTAPVEVQNLQSLTVRYCIYFTYA